MYVTYSDALYAMLYLWGLGGEGEAQGVPCGEDGGGWFVEGGGSSSRVLRVVDRRVLRLFVESLNKVVIILYVLL